MRKVHILEVGGAEFNNDNNWFSYFNENLITYVICTTTKEEQTVHGFHPRKVLSVADVHALGRITTDAFKYFELKNIDSCISEGKILVTMSDKEKIEELEDSIDYTLEHNVYRESEEDETHLMEEGFVKLKNLVGEALSLDPTLNYKVISEDEVMVSGQSWKR